MPIKKIRDFYPKEICRNPEHNPPMYIVLPPGVYEHTCPGCGAVQVFTVSGPTWGKISSIESVRIPMGFH